MREVWLPKNSLDKFRKEGTLNEQYLVEIIDSLAKEVNQLREERAERKLNDKPRRQR